MYGFQEQEKYVKQGISYYRDIIFQGLFLRTKSTDTFSRGEAVVENVFPISFSAPVYSVFYTLDMSLLTIVKQEKILFHCAYFFIKW